MAFQQFINDIFFYLLDVCVMIYLDDILIYSNNMSEYHQHVKEVLKHLCKAGLYAKAKKCKFHSELVEYLEYILSPSGLTMSDDKVKIIQDWPEPKKVKDIQSFLSFTNFYCRFIFNYSDIVILLIRLTWKDIPWKFDLLLLRCFQLSQDMLLLQSFPLLMKIMKFIWLLFTPALSLQQS